VPVTINPRKLRGPWAGGFALDLHTLGSTFLGHNAFGLPEFDTKRSPLGDLLYRLKNTGDRTVIPEIVDTVTAFVKKWSIQIDAIVPVPPSNTRRKHQPVIAVAAAIGAALGVPMCEACVTKVKSTAQLKDSSTTNSARQSSKAHLPSTLGKPRGKHLLLIDDLYRSGATASAIAQLPTGQGAARVVYC
jgi:competence protein ComFC